MNQGHVTATQPNYTVQKSISFLCSKPAASQPVTLDAASSSAGETAILIPQASPDSHRPPSYLSLQLLSSLKDYILVHHSTFRNHSLLLISLVSLAHISIKTVILEMTTPPDFRFGVGFQTTSEAAFIRMSLKI